MDINQFALDPVEEYEMKMLLELAESKRKYRKVVQAAIGQWVRDFQSGKIVLTTVDDFRKLVELDLLLQKDES